MTDATHKPRYDGQNVLLPNPEMLRAGDVVLTSNVESTSWKSARVSGVIRRATNGRFSHALICSDPPVLIEAINTGVSTLSLARCFVHARENVRVLRYHDADIAKRASTIAQLEVGRSYSTARAVQSIFEKKTIAKIDDHGVFCSALVAQAFTSAGATEFAQTPVDKTTPATIDRLGCFTDVTDEIFRVALAPNTIETMTALDGDASPSLSSLQTEISNRYGKLMLPIAERLVGKLPESGSVFAPTTFGLIDLILRSYDAANLQSERYNIIVEIIDELDAELAILIESGEMLSLLEKIISFDDSVMQKALLESFQPHPDIDMNAMNGLLETTRTMLATRRLAYDKLLAWNANRSKSVKAYLMIEARIFPVMSRREYLAAEIIGRVPTG